MNEWRLPETVSPYKLARQGQTLQGRTALNSMPRLTAELAEDEGYVDVELRFEVDLTGVAVVQGRIKADLKIVCQRCMDVMDLALDLNVVVGFVHSDEQAQRIARDYEPCIVPDDRLALGELIEDELLLALPVVPMHDDENCQSWRVDNPPQQDNAEEALPEKKNPFAVLAELKRESDGQ